MSVTKLRLPLTLVFISAIAFGLGISGPALIIRPHFGEFSPLVDVFKPELSKVQVISVVTGVHELFEGGDYLIGGVIVFFSILFPLWKLGVMCQGLYEISHALPASKSLHLIAKLGKFSMLDVFVIALLLMTIKTLPGGTEVSVGWGIGAFTISVILSLKVPYFLEKIEKEISEKG